MPTQSSWSSQLSPRSRRCTDEPHATRDNSSPCDLREVDPAVADRHVHLAVHADASKIEIAAAVASLFTVKVKEVNVLTTKAKETRGTLARSRFPGKTTPWRKAMVTLAPGEKIQFFEGV